MRFLKRINMYKKILPNKCDILLLRLKWNYSWRSLIRDVALAVAETGSSWCVYSCTLKSVGTDFWGRDNWTSFFTTLKAAGRLSVVEDWVNWLQQTPCQAFKKPPTPHEALLSKVQNCRISTSLLRVSSAADQAPSWRPVMEDVLGPGCLCEWTLEQPLHRLYWKNCF